MGHILASSAFVTSGPGDRWQVAVTRHRVSAGASWLYDSYSAAIKSDVHKALIHTDNRGQLIMHFSQFSQAWQHFRETITCHVMGDKEVLFRFMIRCIFGQYLWGYSVDDWRMQSCLSTQRSVLSFNIRYLFFCRNSSWHQVASIWTDLGWRLGSVKVLSTYFG